MLKLSRKADYGLISLKHMATKKSSASAREIAAAYGIPLPILAKVLQKLARTGFLQSENGANGGYRLRRHPSEITALEVIRTIDGPVFLTSCSTGATAAVECRTNVMCASPCAKFTTESKACWQASLLPTCATKRRNLRQRARRLRPRIMSILRFYEAAHLSR